MDGSLARRRLLGWAAIVIWLASSAAAAEGDRLTAERLDDAELTAVTFIDAQRGWAVGDRGAIWQTNDGGRNWRIQDSLHDCRWEHVTFVDATNGWIVGGRVEPGTFKTTGVVLRTRDGGQSWMPLPTTMLPALKRIVCVDDRRGWAIANASAMYPTGLLETQDGGRSWNPRPGRTGEAWLAGDFRTNDESGATNSGDRAARRGARHSRLGIAAGASGKLALVTADEVLETTLPIAPGRVVRQVRLCDEGHAWLIGDEGLVLHSSDAGLQWQKPAGAIPPSIARCDFTALAAHGPHCWIAGAPGTWVLATHDGGATWEVHSTGQSLPIKSLCFIDEQTGWAVGALGTILATRDGGKTWRRQHGGQRLALLAIVSQEEVVPFELLAQLCGNDGYRGGALVLYRRDLETGITREALDEQRLHEAVVASGGSASQFVQRFPVRQAGLSLSIEQHLSGWRDIVQESSSSGIAAGDEPGAAREHVESPEKKLERFLADQIRTWRPDLVFTDDPDATSDSSLAQLTQRAVVAAVHRAALPEAADARPVPGLPAWQVKKVLSTLPGSERGVLRLSSAQLAPRLGRSLGDATMLSRELTGVVNPPTQASFRLLMSQLPQDSGRREFFGGLTLAPGSEARRGATGLGKGDLATLQRSAQQQRNVQQLLLRGGEAARGAAWLAQFDGLTQGLSPESAADVAWHLARRCDQEGQHDQALAALGLIVQKYSRQRWSDAAVVELIRRQSSGELAHWRRRASEEVASAAAAATDANQAESRDAAADQTGVPDATGIARLPAAPATRQTPAGSPPLYVELPTPAPIRRPSRILAAAALTEATDDGATPLRTLPRISATDRADVSNENFVEAAPTNAAETIVNPRDQEVAKLGLWVERSRPWLFLEPNVRAALAGATSRQGRAKDVQQWWRTLANRSRDDGWARVAKQELALTERTPASGAAASLRGLDDRVARCAPCDEAPKLDGRLDEPFWSQTTPLNLNSKLLDDSAWPALVLVARDAEHLYVGILCQKAEKVDYSPTKGARPRDPNLNERDRVDLFLDIDRDYATAYQLTIDSRGWVVDRCLGDARWNPAWYVAARDDAQTWTVEAAIPWRELVEKPPVAGDVWALGAQRTVPGVGFQSWTQPASIEGRADGWGLFVFE